MFARSTTGNIIQSCARSFSVVPNPAEQHIIYGTRADDGRCKHSAKVSRVPFNIMFYWVSVATIVDNSVSRRIIWRHGMPAGNHLPFDCT